MSSGASRRAVVEQMAPEFRGKGSTNTTQTTPTGRQEEEPGTASQSGSQVYSLTQHLRAAYVVLLLVMGSPSVVVVTFIIIIVAYEMS